MHRRFRFNPLKWLGYLYAPIQKNGAFFVFMFALGYLCTQVEIPLHVKGAKPYELSVPELLFDLYAVCVVLTLIPKKIRRFVRLLLYVLFYGVALVDMFCYVKFESTLTPTMLMLAYETTGQEAQEFLSSYLGWDILTSQVGWIVGLMAVHILWTILRVVLAKVGKRMILPKVNEAIPMVLKAVAGCAVAWLVGDACSQCRDNKVAMQRLFSYQTIGQVEHELTRKDTAHLYLPVYRLAFSIYANRLASHQVEQLVAASKHIQVDSCSYRIPNIVLVIGESYNKHHSQLYGYQKPTTPRQMAMAEEGSLVAFTDVVAPWNLTSFVFKNVLSLHTMGEKTDWCDEPLFPEVFRSAGYHVTFITNQFQPKAKEAVYDFSGGFFLNDPQLSKLQFDERNTKLHRYDDGVLKELDEARRGEGEKVNNLVILHLMGSHVEYRARYPQKTWRHFMPEMYDRPELTRYQRRLLSEYDNSLLYNDSIMAEITRRFEDKDAVVIYMPDHGEEIFDEKPYVYGRTHSSEIDRRVARSEYEIPFWIWGSPVYRERHPYNWLAIQNAKDRPMMTDVLPHLLMFLGGISTPLYHPEYNIISPDYDARRPRMLKGTTAYEK